MNDSQNNDIKQPVESQRLPDFLKPNEMAALVNVSIRTLWRLRAKREVPAPVVIGGNVRWLGKDVKEWMEKGCPGDN